MTTRTTSVPLPVPGSARIELRAITPIAAAGLAGGGDGGFNWAPGGPFQGTRDACGGVLRAAEAGVFDPRWGAFAMIRLADGVALGGVGFHGPPSAGVVEIGYDLAASARGQGYATEGVRLVVALALADPEIRWVLARTEPANEASQAVLLRVGFVMDGVGEEGLYRYLLRA